MSNHKLFLIVCEYFVGEVTAVIEAEEFDNVTVAPFLLHCASSKVTWDSLKKIIPASDEYGSVCILAICGATALEDPPRGLEHCHLYKLNQCFHMLVGQNLVNSYQEKGAYLLSPGWLARWRDHIKEWGFDQKTAQEFLGESVTKLLLLDTEIDAKSPDRLAEFAEFVDLPFERLPVGLDFLRMFLSKITLETRIKSEKSKTDVALADKNRMLADSGMALDLLGKLIHTTTEKDTIKDIQNIFSMLFAPGKLIYIPYNVGGQPSKPPSTSTDAVDVEALQKRLSRSNESYAWTESGNGFLLQITHRDETLGFMEVDEIAFPEYKERYVDLAIFIVDVCGIAIDNARKYQQIKLAEEQLKRYASELENRNKEIKQFAHIVSHDMKSPLVNIRGFSEELRSALKVVHTAMNKTSSYLDDKQQSVVKAALREDIPEAMKFIDSSVTSMDHLINAVLEMSRIGHRELQLEPIDMEEVVRNTLKNLTHKIKKHQIKVVVGRLPKVNADRTSMEQVMGNILNNAVIYLVPERPGKIEINAENNGNETIFTVRDNGRGINKSDMHKVFAPFRRAGQKNVKGEGMGMAYVQILIHRHKGRIWCESDLGVGTSFFFTIPHGLVKESLH